MEERLIIQVVGQVMVYDSGAKQWHPAGTSSGLSTVRLIQCLPNNTFRINAQKINEDKEVVLDSQITREVKYNRANEAFIQWHDSKAFWGLNFRRGSPDAENFFGSVVHVLKILNQSAVQQVQQQSLPQEILNNQHQQSQQNSAAIIQRTIQQQQILQHQQPPTQQQMIHQQPPQMIGQHQTQSQLLAQGPPQQLIQQQPNQQQILQQQQQQIHQHYMQQQPPPQTQSQQPSHNQMNHYQQQQQHQLQQQQQEHQIQQQQLQQQQVAPVAAAPVPPPPPPPPPAPGIINGPRANGISASNSSSSNMAPAASNQNNNLQHSPVANSNSISTTNNFGLDSNVNRNGGSPNQSSLASQLKKVNLSRSDSGKESECNNNHIANAKTTRAASLAHVTDNLMNDLNKKLASRRERIDQQGDGQSMSNNGINGLGGDKAHESWLADFIRQELSKMKAEIIETIKTELRQR